MKRQTLRAVPQPVGHFGVEEPVPTFAQQQGIDFRTARVLVTAPVLTILTLLLAVLLYAWHCRKGG